MQETVKQDRERYIGGSDIPVIMDLSPFKTRYDLLLEKAGYKQDDFEGNVYTEYGNKLEPKIRDYLNSKRDPADAFNEGYHVREAEDGEIIGVRLHTDGEDSNSILEIKTTSQIYDSVFDYKIYLVQLLFYMVNTGKSVGTLAVYERPEDLDETFNPDRLHVYNIGLADFGDMVNEIAEALERFIDDLEKVKANPFISEEALLPTEISDIAREIINFENQIKALKDIEAKIKSEKSRLKEAMQRASVKSWTTPSGYKITLVPDGEDKVVTEDNIDLEAMRRDLPELFKDKSEGGYMEKIQIVKKGRAGYVKITEPKRGGV